jgi:hypothetical protein
MNNSVAFLIHSRLPVAIDLRSQARYGLSLLHPVRYRAKNGLARGGVFEAITEIVDRFTKESSGQKEST